MTAEELEAAWRDGRRDFDGVAVEVSEAYVASWTARAVAQRAIIRKHEGLRNTDGYPRAADVLEEAAANDELKTLGLVRETVQRLNPSSRSIHAY